MDSKKQLLKAQKPSLDKALNYYTLTPMMATITPIKRSNSVKKVLRPKKRTEEQSKRKSSQDVQTRLEEV